MAKRKPKLKYGYDDESILQAIKTIINTSEILDAQTSVNRIVKVMARRNAHLGGTETLRRHGREHYINMVNKRWHKPQDDEGAN